MEKTKLRQVIFDQQEVFNTPIDLIDRDIDLDKYIKNQEIIVITGIRRSGKSSLLKIIRDKLDAKSFYLNFDDIRLTEFNDQNFEDIEDIVFEIFNEAKDINFFLDEVQNVKNWERWVNNLYSRNVKVFVTGSNSHLLSSEISTYLTGRNKTIKLFPFSFKEFLLLRESPSIINSSKDKRKIIRNFNEYFLLGGFPVIDINKDLELSRQYFEDIINKDIVKRYGIRMIKEFNDLILYLFSNVSKQYSYSTLKKISGIKSLSMIKNYIDYLKQVFLAYTIPRFDFSIKKQKVSSSKFYAGDNSFLKTIAFGFSENKGQRLENLVFLELVRRNNEIYYYSEKGECDFVIKKGLKIVKAIQVTYDLTNIKTKNREVNGLLEAMKEFKLKEGLILTFDQEDEFDFEDKKVIVKPVWKWMIENGKEKNKGN